MGAEIAHRDRIIPEQFVLQRGTVILDSWRLQVRNRSEDVKRRGGRRVGAKGLNRRVRVRTPSLRTETDKVRRSRVDRGIPARVGTERLEQDRKARIRITGRGDREHSQVRVRKRSGSGTLERIRRTDGGEIGHIVGHGIAQSESGLPVTEDIPGQSGAGAEVFKVNVIQPWESFLYTNQPVREAFGGTEGRLWVMAREEVRSNLVGVTQRAVDVPAQTVADGHSRSNLPLVLEEQSHGRLGEMARGIAKGTAGLVDATKKQLVNERLKIGLEANKSCPRAIPQTECGSILIIAPKLEG